MHVLKEAGFRQTFARLPLETKALEDNGDGTVETPRDEYDIVVCHANVIRYFVLRALQLPPEAWFRVHPNNASITHLKILPGGRVGLYSLGEAGHLEPEENTFNMMSRYPLGHMYKWIMYATFL